MTREELILEQKAMMEVLDTFKSYVYALMEDEIHVGYVNRYEFIKDAVDNFEEMKDAQQEDLK